MKQFPVIAEIHEEVVQGHQNPEVSIRVQKADPSLLYWKPDNVYGLRHFVCREGGQSGTREEWAYVMNDGGGVWTWANWGTKDNRFIKDVIHGHHPAHIGYILIVSRYNWYAPATEPEKAKHRSHGKHCARQIEYVVHLPPTEGFEHLFRTADVRKNVELTERLLSNGIMAEIPEFQEANDILYEMAKDFESAVYLKGLREIIHKSDKRGMSGTFNGVQLMSWVMAGRLMMTFEAPNPTNPKIRDTVTLIGDDPPGEARFGLRSIYATCDRARDLIYGVIRVWENMPVQERSTLFGENKNVTLDVLAGRQAAA